MPESLTSTDSSNHELQQAQLEQVRLQNEKLKGEIVNLQRRKPWHLVAVEMTPMISSVLAVIGFAVGVYQFHTEQTKNRGAQEAQSKREADAKVEQAKREKEVADREFMKPWLENQREIYSEALTAAVTVANTDDEAEKKKALNTFLRLYHGKMVLVETTSVSGTMKALRACFIREKPCDQSDLDNACLALATAMAESMAATAKMTYEEFSKNQFQYSSKL